MILTCPECKARYVVNPSALLPRGRTVRCAKCSHSWFQDKPDEEVEVIEGLPDSTPPVKAEKDQDDAPINKSKSEETKEETKEEKSGEPSGDDFDFPINQPTKRKRPLPKGSNLPALQNQKYGSSKLGWVSLVVFTTAVISVLLIFQETAISSWPASKKLYAAVGLDASITTAPKAVEEAKELAPLDERLKIGPLAPRFENINNVANLIVAGQIENISDGVQDIPQMKIKLSDDKGKVIRDWTFSADKNTAGVSEKVTFETSLPNPPAEARDISVIFITN